MSRDDLSRRELLAGGGKLLVSYALLQHLSAARLLAGTVQAEVDRWVRSLDEQCADLKSRALRPAQWQERIEALLRHVSLEELLAYIDFDALEQRLRYPDLGVDTRSVRFPGFDGLPSGLRFFSKLFGMEEDRAIIPHGHRNMASAHLVLGGRFHLRQYERRGEEAGALILEPSVDHEARAGSASSISDEHNNVHWLIARGGRAYTLDVIVTGLEADRPDYEIDNLDPERAEPVAGGLLRMPKLGLEEALRRYGKDHHG